MATAKKKTAPKKTSNKEACAETAQHA